MRLQVATCQVDFRSIGVPSWGISFRPAPKYDIETFQAINLLLANAPLVVGTSRDQVAMPVSDGVLVFWPDVNGCRTVQDVRIAEEAVALASPAPSRASTWLSRALSFKASMSEEFAAMAALEEMGFRLGGALKDASPGFFRLAAGDGEIAFQPRWEGGRFRAATMVRPGDADVWTRDGRPLIEAADWAREHIERLTPAVAAPGF